MSVCLFGFCFGFVVTSLLRQGVQTEAGQSVSVAVSVAASGDEKRELETDKAHDSPAEQQRIAALEKMGHIEQEFLSMKDTYFARKV